MEDMQSYFQETVQHSYNEEIELKSMMKNLNLNVQAQAGISKKKIKKVKLNIATNPIIQRRKQYRHEFL